MDRLLRRPRGRRSKALKLDLLSQTQKRLVLGHECWRVRSFASPRCVRCGVRRLCTKPSPSNLRCSSPAEAAAPAFTVARLCSFNGRIPLCHEVSQAFNFIFRLWRKSKICTMVCVASLNALSTGKNPEVGMKPRSYGISVMGKFLMGLCQPQGLTAPNPCLHQLGFNPQGLHGGVKDVALGYSRNLALETGVGNLLSQVPINNGSETEPR